MEGRGREEDRVWRQGREGDKRDRVLETGGG